jgi:hypothetical protein
MRYLLLFFMIVSAFQLKAGDNYSFKWLEDGKEVGQLLVSTETESGETKITFDSKITVDVGEKVEVHDIYRNVVKNDTVFYAGVVRYFNSKPRITIIEQIFNNVPSKTINKEEKPFERAFSVFTYTMLYVQPPVNVESLYYEIHGEMFKIQSKGNNTYVLTGPNDRKEEFTYNEKGQLIAAKIETNFGFYSLVQSK